MRISHLLCGLALAFNLSGCWAETLAPHSIPTEPQTIQASRADGFVAKQLVASARAQIGVTLRVRDVPYTEYAANVSRKMPLYTSYWSGSATLFELQYVTSATVMPRSMAA